MAAFVFNFEDLSSDRAEQALARYFRGVGEQLVQVNVDPRIRRSSGISYKQIELVFADGQKVRLMVKQSGDIFQVAINGKPFPIKSQDDQEAAIAEIVAALDAGRTKFQAALAKARAVLPPSVRTARPRMEVMLRDKLNALNEAISLARDELAALDAPTPVATE